MQKYVSEVPELMEIWDFEKNKDIDPATLAIYSRVRVFWKCRKCGYEWVSSVKNVTRAKKKCPKCDKCSYKKVCVKDDPNLMKYWGDNPNKNPADIARNSKEVVNWHCPDCGSEWELPVYRMARAKWPCKECMNRERLKKDNVLRKYPELLYYYDNDYPGNPRLDKLFLSSDEIVHWKCPDCGYEWDQRVKGRIRRDKDKHRVTQCPVCAGVKTGGNVKSFAEKYPDMAAEWDNEKNGRPIGNTRCNSTNHCWWRCKKGHLYTREPVKRVEDYKNGEESCRVCAGTKIVYETSFMAYYPEAAKEWDYDRNKDLAFGPDHVAVDATTYYYWLCSEGHNYRLAPATIARRIDAGQTACPYCDNRRVLGNFNSLAHTDKELAEEWSENNKRPPTEVMKSNAVYARWNCPTCGGEYLARICDREIGDDACPYCANRKVLPKFNDFKTVYEDLAKELAGPENELLLIDMDALSVKDRRKLWWVCPDCGKYYLMSVYDRIMKAKRKHTPCIYCKGRRRTLIHYF